MSEPLPRVARVITTVAIRGYRSLREVALNLGQVTVVTGGNGSGKSSLYRALRLLASTADGDVVGALAREGGLPAVLWAGPEHITGAMRRGEVPVQGTGSRKRPVSLMLGFTSHDWGYLIDIGLPTPSRTMFHRDPVIKREAVFVPPVMRPASTLVSRLGARVLTHEGRNSRELQRDLTGRMSLISEVASADAAPEVRTLRHELRSWRFHDSFRVDAQAPARQPHVGTWTPVLANDGADLAPAVQTILESAWADPFRSALHAALPGTDVQIIENDGLFTLTVVQEGLLRPLAAAEVSDGTLRFLMLATALLSPDPPALVVLNEPESSLHPDVLPGVAHLVAAAARQTQVVVVSHSTDLVQHLEQISADNLVHHELTKRLGETVVDGQGLLGRPTWNWGTR